MKLVRERYNSGAHQSCPGSLKKSKLLQHALTASAETADPNAEILAPKSREQKEKERKERLIQELAARSESKVSSKRRKRLEKYIDKKLRQDERMLIVEKLAYGHLLIRSDPGVNTDFGAAVLFYARDRRGCLSSGMIDQN
ncbi:hypothetical protein J3R83DRAFT_11983 [Lanmaoa asiatica]|nr:hypothetical protein J3R83DRAFT_11983 [Lanmaoa asiatica]